MEFRGIMGGFYRISEWIMRLSVINILWVICSFPFFYLVLAGLVATAENPEIGKQSLVLLAIVAPFTLFPATGAMFTVARKWVTGDEDVPLFKTFFRGYKENYVQSMLGGLFFILMAVILYVNQTFYLKQGNVLGLLSIFFIVLMIILSAAMFHFFSMMVHFHMKFFQILKNSILITIGNPVSSVLLIVTNAAVLYFSVYQFTFLIPFFMGSIMATVSFWYFYRIFEKIKTLSEKQKQKELEETEEAEAEAGVVSEVENGSAQTGAVRLERPQENGQKRE